MPDLRRCNNIILGASISHIGGVKGSDKDNLNGNCYSCPLRNLTRKLFNSRDSDIMAFNPIERIYTDVVGQMKCISTGKAKYFVMFYELRGHSMVRFVFDESETVKS